MLLKFSSFKMSSSSTSTSFQGAPTATTGSINTVRSRSNSPQIHLVDPLPNMSLFIPYIFPNIKAARIRKVFDTNQIGQVERVDFVTKIDKNGQRHNCAYIHFDHWYLNTSSYNLQDRIRNPAVQARVVYDDPWYWVVMENTSVDAALSTADLLAKNAALNANKENIDPNRVSSASTCLKQLLGVGTVDAAGQQQQKRIPLQLQVIAVDEDTSLVDCAYVECIEEQNCLLVNRLAEQTLRIISLEQQNSLLVNRLAEQTLRITSLEQHLAWLAANFDPTAFSPITVIQLLEPLHKDDGRTDTTGSNLANDFELEFERNNDIAENR